MRCEFSLIRYVPDVVKGEFANIGVVLRPEGEGAEVRFTRDWGRVRCLDPGADVELLESLEMEIGERLRGGDVGAVKPVLTVLVDTLSNSVQMSEMRGTLAENVSAEMDQLMRLYVEPMRVERKRRASGRAAIVAQTREQFERAGVWRLMRKRIRAAEYTQAGDPMRIDCGYRNGVAKMFHAVSLDGDVEGAKSLAYSADALRAGVRSVEEVELELTAIVEPIAGVSDEEPYRFGVRAMERESIRVMTVADLGRIAATARRELRV